MAAPDRHIHYPFATSLIGGSVMEEPDYDAYIVQLIKQVLLTAKGERINRPDFGAGLRRHVFAPLNDATAALSKTIVYDALVRWLGTLIRVESVNTSAMDAILNIEVQYIVIAKGERRVLNQEVVF
jgi:phage baseplate assembly protein W